MSSGGTPCPVGGAQGQLVELHRFHNYLSSYGGASFLADHLSSGDGTRAVLE